MDINNYRKNVFFKHIIWLKSGGGIGTEETSEVLSGYRCPSIVCFFTPWNLMFTFNGYWIFRILKIRVHLEPNFILLKVWGVVLIFHNKYSYWDNWDVVLIVVTVVVLTLHYELWNSNCLRYFVNTTNKALQNLWYFGNIM